MEEPLCTLEVIAGLLCTPDHVISAWIHFQAVQGGVKSQHHVPSYQNWQASDEHYTVIE